MVKDMTEEFGNILTRFRNQYGDKALESPRLVKIHPLTSAAETVKRALRLPTAVIRSIKHDGVHATGKNVIKKLSHNILIRKSLRNTRNNKYNSILRSLRIVKSPEVKLAIVVHLYYPEMWPILEERLHNINVPFDLYISVQDRDKHISIDKIDTYHQATYIIPLPNRGRDVLPFLVITRLLRYNKYEYLLKLHSKKSPHRSDGDEWMKGLLDELVPSDISRIIKTLDRISTGSIGPASHVVSLSRYMGDNRNAIETIVTQISTRGVAEQVLANPSRYPFFGGTMFWCRLDYLEPLLNSDLTPDDFNSEQGQIDGTTAHAIERILGKTLHEISNKKMYCVRKGKTEVLPNKSFLAKYKYVD